MKLLLGTVIVFSVVTLNLLANVLAKDLLTTGFRVPTVFMVYFDVNFDIVGFLLARCHNKKKNFSLQRDVSNNPDVLPLLLPLDDDDDDSNECEDVRSQSIIPTTSSTMSEHPSRISPARLRWTGLLLFFIYQAGNVLYFWGLECLSLTIGQIIYQSATFFVFLFSLLLLKERVHPYKVASLTLCIMGVSMTTLSADDQGEGNHNATIAPSSSSAVTAATVYSSPYFGVLYLVFGAALWALYEVLIPTLLPNASVREIDVLIGWRGTWNMCLFWCAPLLQYVHRPESYAFLTHLEIFLPLCGMGVISVLLSILIAVGITVTSPVFMRIGAALNAPVTLLWDVAHGRAPTSAAVYIGCALTMASFIFVSLEWNEKDEEDEAEEEGSTCTGRKKRMKWTWTSNAPLTRSWICRRFMLPPLPPLHVPPL